jgi:hypothetical protein
MQYLNNEDPYGQFQNENNNDYDEGPAFNPEQPQFEESYNHHDNNFYAGSNVQHVNHGPVRTGGQITLKDLDRSDLSKDPFSGREAGVLVDEELR